MQVVGLCSGPELDSFDQVKAGWEEQTGMSVNWTGTTDLPNALASGSDADIAILPNLALLQQLAAAGKLVPLDTALDMAQFRRDYAQSWIDLGSVKGKLYGLFNKSPTRLRSGTAQRLSAPPDTEFRPAGRS